MQEEPVGTETENGRTVCQMPIRQPDLRVEFIEPKVFFKNNFSRHFLSVLDRSNDPDTYR